VRKLWHSPTIRSAVVYGASGLGFSGANLILAPVLPTPEYGVFTLAIPLINLAYSPSWFPLPKLSPVQLTISEHRTLGSFYNMIKSTPSGAGRERSLE
jgi:hypothetical protein